MKDLHATKGEMARLECKREGEGERIMEGGKVGGGCGGAEFVGAAVNHQG